MNNHARQVRRSVQPRIVPVARIAVELQLRHVATRIIRAYIPHVPEACRTIHIRIIHLSYCSLLVVHVQRYGVHKVRLISALEHAQLHALRTLTVISWTPAYSCYHVPAPQIQSYPRVRPFIRGKERIHISVKRIFGQVLCSGCRKVHILYRRRRPHWRSRQEHILRRNLRLSRSRTLSQRSLC